jgi:hypothetical protein
VRNGQGFSPVLFKTKDYASVPSIGMAGKLLIEAFDPLQNGLTFKLELFDIGSEYNAVMGARREADVLLTDGIIAGGFTRGGQLPTLNIANEFVDWDEPWYESCIGWRGATGLVEYAAGGFKANLEYTYLGYNTNAQNRDVKNTYPDFLYTHGFTDTTAFTADADYANVYDRGKDPRSVYTQWQDRRTHIAVLNLQYLLPRIPFLPGLAIAGKGKYVNDRDGRVSSNPNDDYLGRMYMGMLQASLQPTNEWKVTGGVELSYWDEDRRNGSEQSGFHDARTYRQTWHVGTTYAYGGVLLAYTLEYFHKDLKRDPRAYYDMVWNVVRAKATAEVAF